jgi:uncharacterized protein YyaL (SSP411 family)
MQVPESLPGAPPFPAEVGARLAEALASREPRDPPRTRNRREDASPLYTNRLLLETSPYLRQHAHNPVDWHPWGEEAFEEARRLDRPVFLSIGYSTCHWCHVMEDESFDEPEIARILNQHFIAIKVDREVRPDVDAIYMSAVQAMTGSGGWPLSVWLTPERRPFYGGTYFPPRDRGPYPGLATVLQAIQQRYSRDRAQLEEVADQLTRLIQQDLEAASAKGDELPGDGALRLAMSRYARSADRARGGLIGQMKFPSSLPIRFLLRIHRRSGDPDALALATLTLERMAAGGIHDQIGGGFHRYSTDPDWLVPHFEKMLYDNALLALAYLEAWQASGRADFAEVTREILRYAEREMAAPEGGFFSATDADSPNQEGEPEEGWFFTWTPEEIRRVVGAERARLVNAYLGVTERGNHEGRSVLHRERDAAELALELGIGLDPLLATLRAAREQLYQARAQRPAPLRDEKILAAWNGLMISAFARSGFALEEPAYTETARRAARFVLERMREEGRLLRTFQGGRAAGPAFRGLRLLIAGLRPLRGRLEPVLAARGSLAPGDPRPPLRRPSGWRLLRQRRRPRAPARTREARPGRSYALGQLDRRPESPSPRRADRRRPLPRARRDALLGLPRAADPSADRSPRDAPGPRFRARADQGDHRDPARCRRRSRQHAGSAALRASAQPGSRGGHRGE